MIQRATRGEFVAKGETGCIVTVIGYCKSRPRASSRNVTGKINNANTPYWREYRHDTFTQRGVIRHNR
jgi:hypothetical protein